MICWGERNCCGVFIDQSKDDRCNCLRDNCIRDYTPEQRIAATEDQLDYVLNRLDDDSEDNFVEMDQMLSVKSIPERKEYAGQTKQLIDRLATRLNELDFDVKVVELQSNGTTHFVIYANYFSTPAKNVVLIYGHVAVPFIGNDDGWAHAPYKLTRDEKNLYGCGLATTKGPVMSWIQAATAWLRETEDLPVNLRFIIDTFSDSVNNELRQSIEDNKAFFSGVDLVITNTNMWITENKPLLSTNHSGYAYFELEFKRPKQKQCETDAEEAKEPDPPSEVAPRQPLAEMCLLMATLTDPHSYLTDCIKRHVLPITHHDWDILCIAEVGIMEFKETNGIKRLLHEESQPVFLKHRWCMPCLTIHSIHHEQFRALRDFHMHQPERILSKFSVKLVPDQSIKYIEMMVRHHLNEAYLRLNCQNPAYLRLTDSLKPINSGRNSPFCQAAYRAYERVFDVQALIPDTISVCAPTINVLRKYCMNNAQMLGMPFCSVHTSLGGVDEGLTIRQQERNWELCATMLYEVALVPPECKCTEIKDFCSTASKNVYRDFLRLMDPARTRTNSAFLYELHDAQIEKPAATDIDLPKVSDILLGKIDETDKLD